MVEDRYIIEGMCVLVKDVKLIVELVVVIMVGVLLVGLINLKLNEKVCVVLFGGNWDLGDFVGVYVGG